MNDLHIAQKFSVFSFQFFILHLNLRGLLLH